MLLAACAATGGHEAAQGPAAEKEPIPAASGQPGGASGVLNARQVADVLPRQGAVPGAVAVGKRMVFGPTHSAMGCAPGKPNADLCADALAIGHSLFSKKVQGTVTFSVTSYKNTSASAAYDTLHAMWQADRDLTTLAIGPVG
ncbi:hypothetical protein [Streptomyces xantholiticus]|uniref:hypothetical protein n=1 Tax=Streptomyces xantholiticus TaxID=68285 RepID=UPI00167AC75E|nr:hypothetical protein [Streptomyces xantholiticus]